MNGSRRHPSFCPNLTASRSRNPGPRSHTPVSLIQSHSGFPTLPFQATDQPILAFDLFNHFHPAVPKCLFLCFLRSDACHEEKHVYETSSIARTTSIDRIPANLFLCNHIVFSHVVAMTNYLLPSPPMQNTSLMGRIL
jgi:hypothetical protein